MPLDAVCLRAVVSELDDLLSGGKVDKVQQPEKDEIIISFRTKQNSCKLLISAGTGDARLHLSTATFENPQQPPMFCMLLRKHLVGAVLTRISQIPGERAAELVFSYTGAFGETGEKRLVAEMMGRYSNIILVDGDGTIIDCLRRVDMTMSEKRQVLPGLIYRVPPEQTKIPFLSASDAHISEMAKANGFDKAADKWLLDTFSGISPLGCREIAFAAYGETDRRITPENANHLETAVKAASDAANEGKFTPYLLMGEGNRPADFYCFPVRQYGKAREGIVCESFSQLLEEFYSGRARAERVRQRSAAMTKSVKNARDRLARKLAMQNEELKQTFDRERLRQYGDIVSANIHLMNRGMTVLNAVDFYDPDGNMCQIPLDPAKSPQQNAAKFYKDYTKAKNAEKILTEQILSGEAELDYLNSVLEEIERASGEADLAEIRQELEHGGYLKTQNKGKQKPRKSEPMRFISSTGVEIRVGKNNTQNDLLTLRSSFKTDIWLHTQKIHGSHVVISSKDGTTDETTLTEAAMLAALFSKAANASGVPVDYTMIKYVKKPSGAKPGMVVYTDYKTVYVTPDESLAKRLKYEEKR